MTNSILDQEADYFNEINKKRSLSNVVYPEIDCRTSDLYLPLNPDEYPCDPYVARIFSFQKDKALEVIKLRGPGNSIDVCCGPGWFNLEHARLGYFANGIDISLEAINIAQNYKLSQSSDVQSRLFYTCSTIESFLSANPNLKFDLVTGWSSFHHLLDIKSSLSVLHDMANEGAIFISFDDLDYDPISQFLRKFFLFLLPVRGISYLNKLKSILLIHKILLLLYRNSVDSPAEIAADKYINGASQIHDFFISNLTDFSVHYQGAFAEAVSYRLNIKSNSLRVK